MQCQNPSSLRYPPLAGNVGVTYHCAITCSRGNVSNWDFSLECGQQSYDDSEEIQFGSRRGGDEERFALVTCCFVGFGEVEVAD